MRTHLFVPPSMKRFVHERMLPGPGLRHVALEYDLVASLRPRLVVDLGAGDATSFLAYCQSMLDHDIDGTCYAIDAWQDPPEHRQSFDWVNAEARKRFPGITYVVKMPPVEARQHFDEETIDLLRIDGMRSDVVAGADVETWFRRVRPGGLVLWHGAHDNPGLWSLIASRCESLLFAEGRGGLGVARKEGPPPEAELLRLLFVDGEGATIDQFYRHMYQHMDFIRILEATGRAM